MALNNPKPSLFPVNGVSDNRGKICGCFGSTTPIEATLCEWPWFPILPPPMTNAVTIKKSQNGPTPREKHTAQ